MQDLFIDPVVPITLPFDKCYMHSTGWVVSVKWQQLISKSNGSGVFFLMFIVYKKNGLLILWNMAVVGDI